MITLNDNRLVFRFPEVHAHAECNIEFQRTLRIPNDDRDHPLPPGLGNFPLRHLDDYAPNLPATWTNRGGVIMPMRQAEAMWVNFVGPRHGYPFAVKVAAGKINAVTGETWTNGLNSDPQDYMVVPGQPWLDGYCVEKGTIRQFVAAPLGGGHTAEEQLTGASVHGGIQLIVYPMKAERYARLVRDAANAYRGARADMLLAGCQPAGMGLAPGGRMKQEIYDDEHGLDAWDQRHSSRCFITIANAAVWQAITGELPPGASPTAADYTKAGLPWFDYYDGEREALAGAKLLAGLKSYLKEAHQARDAGSEAQPAPAARIIQLKGQRPREVREAGF
jgi:hypothetical protein